MTSAWSDPSKWKIQTRRESCPICARGEPLDVLVEFSESWVTGGGEAPLPGYACVVSKHHVVEPFQLSDADGAGFWRDAMLAARVLDRLFNPLKMNYEIHGNTIPHLHLHLFPRFDGDPFVGRPIDAREAQFSRTGEDLARMRPSTLQRARKLEAGGPGCASVPRLSRLNGLLSLDNHGVSAGCALLVCGFLSVVAAGCGGRGFLRSPSCSAAIAAAPALGGAGGSTLSVVAPPFAAVSVGGFSFVTVGGFTGVDELEVFRDEGPRLHLVGSIALPLPGASGEALTPDGRRLLIAAGRGLVVVDVRLAEADSRRAVLGTLQAPAGSNAAEELSRTSAVEVAVTARGGYAFVSLEYAGLVAVFNLRNAEAADWRRSGFVGFVPIGIVNVGLALSPDGHTLYVTRSYPYLQGRRTPRPGTLVLVNVARAEHEPGTAVEARVSAGCGPLRVAPTPDGMTVWVTAGDSDALLAFSAAALARHPRQALIRDVLVGEHPVGLVLIDGGKRIIVMNSNRFNISHATASLSLVDGTNGKLLGTIQTGLFPREGTVEANGRILLVTDYGSQQLQTLQLEGLP